MATIVLTGLSWYILITATLVTVSLFFFVILLIRKFIIKKTIGIILLMIFYFGLTLGELLNTVGLWYYSFISTSSPVSAYLELTFSLFVALGYIFLYLFMTRHIIRDNDLIKASTSILLATLIGIITTLMLSEVFFDVPEPKFFHELPMIGTNINQYLPSLLAGVLIFIPIFLFIHIRIIIRLFFIRRNVEEKLERWGFTYIIISLASFILSAISASLFTIPGIQLYPWLIIFFHTMRIIFLEIGLIVGYFGWIFPDWLRERIMKRI